MTADSQIVVNLPTLYPKQRAVFYDPARIVVCEASTKSGKSVGAMRWLLDLAAGECRGKSLLWVSPVYPQAKVQFERVCRWFMAADPKCSTWNSNRSDLWFEFCGTRITFKGSDSFDSIYGADYAAVVVDEATRHREEVWPAVRSTTTKTRGKIRVIGNSKGRKNWAHRLGMMAKSGADGMAFHRLTAYDAVDAGILDREEVESARRVLPAHVFAELYLAEPSEDGSNPFGLGYISACVAPMSDNEPERFGIDLARKVDYTVVVGLDSAGAVCRFDRWQGLSWEHTMARIAQIVGEAPALCDSTGLGDVVVEGLMGRCPGLRGHPFTERSKQQLMENLAVEIQSRRLSFPPGDIVRELESFEYEPTRTGARYSAPSGLHDDCVCALALAAYGRATAKPLNISVEFIDEVGVDTMPWRDFGAASHGW